MGLMCWPETCFDGPSCLGKVVDVEFAVHQQTFGGVRFAQSVLRARQTPAFAGVLRRKWLKVTVDSGVCAVEPRSCLPY
jgi:hypothetical protein